MTKEQQHSKRCEAMIRKEIADPDSQSGIDLCLNCPYEYCVALENVEQYNHRIARGRKAVAIRLKELKVSVEDIALVLSVSVTAVRGYLRKR